MPDDPELSDSEQETSPADTPKGYMISIAVVLIAILVVLVIFMNLSGQGNTAATAVTANPWQLQSYAGPDGTTVPAVNSTTVTASFTLNNGLTGSGGCNQYSARYLVKETSIVISGVASTKMNCPGDGVMEQESRYFSLLEQAAALRVHDRALTLYGTDGKPLLVLTAA